MTKNDEVRFVQICTGKDNQYNGIILLGLTEKGNVYYKYINSLQDCSLWKKISMKKEINTQTK